MQTINKILKFTHIIFVVHFSLIIAQGESKDNSNGLVDPAYTYLNSSKLYLPSEKFENTEQVRAYLKNSIFWSSLELVGRNCLDTVIVISLIPISYWGIKKILPADAAPFTLTAILNYFLWNGGLSSKSSHIFNIFKVLIFGKTPDSLDDLEIQFIFKAHNLSPYLQEETSKLLLSIRKGEIEFNNDSKLYLENVINLPSTFIEAKFDENIIKENLRGLNETLIEDLIDFTLKVYWGNRNEKYNQKSTAFFLGEPGSGKTQAAKRIAQSLGLPYCLYNLAGKSVKDLIGNTGGLGGTAHPGLIAQCKIKTNCKNPFIILDDVDRVFNDELLTFMLSFNDPEVQEIDNAYYKDKQDISKLTAIYTANLDFSSRTSQSTVALKQRIETFEFDGFDPTYQKEYITNIYLSQLIHDHSEYLLKINDFKEDLNLILNEADAGMRVIISKVKKLFYKKLREKKHNCAIASFPSN